MEADVDQCGDLRVIASRRYNDASIAVANKDDISFARFVTATSSVKVIVGFCATMTSKPSFFRRWYTLPAGAVDEAGVHKNNGFGNRHFFSLAAILQSLPELGGNNAEIVRLYTSAAAKGIAEAESNLAELYETGFGVSKDQTEAMNLYCKAARDGSETSKQRLAARSNEGINRACGASQ